MRGGLENAEIKSATLATSAVFDSVKKEMFWIDNASGDSFSLCFLF